MVHIKHANHIQVTHKLPPPSSGADGESPLLKQQRVVAAKNFLLLHPFLLLTSAVTNPQQHAAVATGAETVSLQA
jgi:hypothetical protein